MSRRKKCFLKVIDVLLCVAVVIFMMAAFLSEGAHAAVCSSTIAKSVAVVWYDKDVDYTQEIKDALDEGGEYALQKAVIYEQMRNAKIDGMKLNCAKWDIIKNSKTIEEARSAFAHVSYSVPKLTDQEINLLYRVVNAEAGSDWIPDWVQRGVASVVLNRIRSSSYPNTMRDVVYQSGQWSCAWNGSLQKSPSKKVVNNVNFVLRNGMTMPEKVTGFSSVSDGLTIHSFWPNPYGYDCYFLYAG